MSVWLRVLCGKDRRGFLWETMDASGALDMMAFMSEVGMNAYMYAQRTTPTIGKIAQSVPLKETGKPA